MSYPSIIYKHVLVSTYKTLTSVFPVFSGFPTGY